jgi:hypothetical protein
VSRETEVDYRQLYSEWLSSAFLEAESIDFSRFPSVAQQWLRENGYDNR